MAQMYNIYINEVRLRLTENVPKGLNSYKLLEEKDFSIVEFYQKVINTAPQNDFVICTKNPKLMLERIATHLSFIIAAGGFVQNAEGNYLFIFRRGKWDLPKGKVDEGERIPTAALREVEEECGLKVDELGELLAQTYHIYPMGEDLVLKRTDWYQMRVLGVPVLVPQTEEDITEAVWLSPNELAQVKANTFPLIRDLIEPLS